MQYKRSRPALQRNLISENGRQSMSRASTPSRDTTTPQESFFGPDAKYAPIRPQSQQSTQPDENRMTTPVEGHLSEHPGMEHIHDYNNSQNSTIDPQLGKLNGDAFRQSDSEQRGTQAAVETLISAAQQVPSRHGSQALDAAAGEKKGKKEKKAVGTTAANEKELRELIENNKHRTLESIARDVRNAERTQKSERFKQLFAMRWLREFCRQDKESVPRNRVYTYYAQRCGTDRVDTLNPASFGKLVRVIFPGIATRRLGVRGESKYHYVNLTLVDDPYSALPRPGSRHESIPGFADRETPVEPEQFILTNINQRHAVDSSVFPKNDDMFDAPAPPPMPSDGTNPHSHSRVFANTNASGFRTDAPGPQVFTRSLKFSSKDQVSLQNDPLCLPDVRAYLTRGTDPEMADSLNALYRSHCTSMVDAVRYVKEKQFVRLLGAFNGTMTAPVARIFSLPSVAPWIKSCDLLMYQQIIRFVSQLALQVMPTQVYSMLKSVSAELPGHIRKQCRQYPEHVVQAKLEPATVFASLLDRLLRVNETAHAAANMLTNDGLRDMMWQDWVKNVRPKRVIESALSMCGHEEAYYILTSDVRTLLEPLVASDWLEEGTEYQRPSQAGLNRGVLFREANSTADNIVERWAMFLNTIPARFPEAQTRTLIHCVESIGCAILRDITVNQGPSFGVWWVTKVWLDEMMLWMAESGGFLESQQIAPESPHDSETLDHLFREGRDEESRASPERPESAGLGIDFPSLANFAPVNESGKEISGPPAATFKFSTKASDKPDSLTFDIEDQHDDSGIGMSMLTDGAPAHPFEPPSAGSFSTLAR